MRPRGFIVPHLQGVQHPLSGARQCEVDNHRRAARQRRAGAGLKVIGRIGAHKRHL